MSIPWDYVAQITAFKHHGQLKVKSAKIVNRKQAQTNCPWLIVDADAEQAIGDLDTRSSWKYDKNTSPLRPQRRCIAL
ncbi:MAG: hypothetical protein IPI14_08885 [Polaromonas sp.]|nr:hypothetical protein [Polaromonas sp.]